MGTAAAVLGRSYMGGDCSSNDKGNEEMGVCDSQDYESPFDAVFSRQIDLYKVEMHKNCIDFSALVTGIRNMLPEVWEHYDKNNDGTLQQDEFDVMMSEFFPALERWVPKYVDLASQHLIKMAGDDADKKAQLEAERIAQISLWNSTIKKWSDPEQCPEHLDYFKLETVMTKDGFLQVMATRINSVWSAGDAAIAEANQP